MALFGDEAHAFYEIFETSESFHLDGLELLSFEKSSVNFWPFGFRFACSLSHRAGSHLGRLRAECVCKRGNNGRLVYQVSSPNLSEDVGQCKHLSDMFRCVADAYYHGTYHQNYASIRCTNNNSAQILEYPHYALTPLINAEQFDRGIILRADVAELIVQRNILRAKLSSSKVSTCPWYEPLVSRGYVHSHKKMEMPLMPALPCSLLQRMPKYMFYLPDHDIIDGGWEPKLDQPWRQTLVCAVEDSLSNCQKHVERLLFCHLKRKQLRCSGSEKKQRVEPELAPSRLEKNSQHRQLRERERESDRLGRLLRRAAELDVTRCCNDVRTLLVARGQCEEANLQVCSPPSVQGEYGAGPYARGMSSTSNSAISFNQVPSSIPPTTNLASRPNSDSTAFRVANFLCTFTTPDHYGDFPSATFVFPPSGCELSAALNAAGVVEALTVTHNEVLLSAVATTLVRCMIAPLFRALGQDKHMYNLQEVLPVNCHVWPSLAKLIILLSGFRELGLADAELLPEIQGIGRWCLYPDSETTDSHYHDSLLDPPFSSQSQESTTRESYPKTIDELKIRIPAPGWIGVSASDTSSMGNLNLSNEDGYTCMRKTAETNIEGSWPIGAHHNEEELVVTLNRAKSACHIMLSSLLSLSPMAGLAANISVVYSALCQAETQFQGDHPKPASVIFIHAMRHSLYELHRNSEAAGNLPTCELFAVFTDVVLEYMPYYQAVSQWETMQLLSRRDAYDSEHNSTSSHGVTLYCQNCDACNHIHCLNRPSFDKLFTGQPLCYFCSNCSEQVGQVRARHVMKMDCSIPAGVSLSAQGGVQHFPSDLFVSRQGHLASGIISQKLNQQLLIRETQEISNQDVEILIRAISSLSQDLVRTQDSWIIILHALVNCAATITDPSLPASATGTGVASDSSLPHEEKEQHVQFLHKAKPPPESESHSSADNFFPVVQLGVSGEALPSNVDRKKQRETNLVSGVIEAAASCLEDRYDIAPGVVAQIASTALKGNQDADGTGSTNDTTFLHRGRVKFQTDLGSCILCGGDHDYLNSSLRCSNEVLSGLAECCDGLRAGGKSVRTRLPHDVAHEFCAETLSLSRGFVCKKLRQRCAKVQFEALAWSRIGRTTPIGVDQAGRVYWRIISEVSSLQVETPCFRQAYGTSDQLRSSHQWHAYNSVPAIARVIRFLGVDNDHDDTLSMALASMFPEAAAAMPAIPWSTGANTFNLVEATLQLNAHPVSLRNTSHYTGEIVEPQHKVDNFVFVRNFNVLWYAKISTVGLHTDGNKIYRLWHSNWDREYDRWVADEQLCVDTCACSISQQFLYQARLVGNKGPVLGCTAKLSTLVAYDFIGTPFRIACSPPSLVLSNSGAVLEVAHVRAALLLVESALPLGAKAAWSSENSIMRSRRLEMASTPLELVELVLMLEDELQTNWLRAHWFSMRACVPNRTYLIQHPTCSWVALLVWLLDRALIYNKVLE